MELQVYFEILRRRKWIILLVTLLVTGLAGLYTYLATPMYLSSSTLRVVTVGSDGIGGRPDTNYTQLLMNTYVAVVGGGSVRNEIMTNLNLQEQPSITVSPVRNTELLRIQVEAANPIVAHDVANEMATIIIRESKEQYSGDGQSMLDILSRQLEQVDVELQIARENYDQLLNDPATLTATLEATRQSIEAKERTYATLLGQYETARVNEAVRANSVYVVDPAYIPGRPSSPRQDVNLVIGFLAGLFFGVVTAFLRDALDTRLYSNDQIETVMSSPIIGEIPRSRDQLRIAYSGNGHDAQSEAFRRLRVNVLAPHMNDGNDDNVKTILVTSVKDGEGKSTVAGNLAVTMARSGRRVILVDCNIHQPSAHKLFDLQNDAGLTELLVGHASAAGVIQATKLPRLSVLSSGSGLLTAEADSRAIMPTGLVERLSQGVELLGSPNMVKVLRELREQYDIVVLDSPAFHETTDAIVLTPLVDEIVLVVSRQRTQRDELKSAHRQLANIRAKSVGVVVNG